MDNIINYAAYEMSTFDEAEFTAVDSLCLSQLSYLKFENVENAVDFKAGVPLRELFSAELFPKLFRGVNNLENNRKLFYALCASPRFRGAIVKDISHRFDEKEQTQFFAMSFILADGLCFVAFRGTDSTLVGWKEDFNMTFSSAVPSQLKSADYLRGVGRRFDGDIIVGGHSKGGNLAVYSALHVSDSVLAKVRAVFSHDGPGFKESVITDEKYLMISDRIHKTLPQSSLIGMLLETGAEYKTVISNRVGVMQHDPFSWCVKGRDFCYTDKISSGASRFTSRLSDWLSRISDEDRYLFIDALYDIISASHAKTVNDLPADLIKNGADVIRAAGSLDAETKEFIKLTLLELISIQFKR